MIVYGIMMMMMIAIGVAQHSPQPQNFLSSHVPTDAEFSYHGNNGGWNGLACTGIFMNPSVPTVIIPIAQNAQNVQLSSTSNGRSTTQRAPLYREWNGLASTGISGISFR